MKTEILTTARVLVFGLFAAGLMMHETVNAADAKPDPAAYARGAVSWAQNCARCHNMRDPKEFRDDLWRPIVYHMRVRAGLTEQETRDILLFLQGSN